MCRAFLEYDSSQLPSFQNNPYAKAGYSVPFIPIEGDRAALGPCETETDTGYFRNQVHFYIIFLPQRRLLKHLQIQHS